ncbi:MAG: hypothetical protein K8T91_27955 [Planctomycetes bacterium]|nr:hypothetical protein [Planctomycetota bacterium]
MASKRMNFFVGVLWLGVVCLGARAGAEEAAPAPIDAARAEALGRKIDEIQTQLSKLDQILEQLRRLRTEELPKLQQELRGAGEASVLVKNGERTVQKPEAPPTTPQANETDKPNSAPQSLETQLAAVQERLQQLDDVSQQITALRGDDLPRLKRELERLKGSNSVARSALRPVPAVQGRLVINNLSGLTRDVTVNGTTYTFAPGSWQVSIPYRDVTTQVALGEIPRLWGSDFWRQTDNGPEMRLDLR